MQAEQAAGVPMVCPKCGHRWTYTGGKVTGLAEAKSKGYSLVTSCPRCRKSNVKIGA